MSQAITISPDLIRDQLRKGFSIQLISQLFEVTIEEVRTVDILQRAGLRLVDDENWSRVSSYATEVRQRWRSHVMYAT